MKTKSRQSVLIPASYLGEVTPDEAINARTFFVLRMRLFASDAKGNKSVAEQRKAYFLNVDDRDAAVEQAKQLGWSVEVEMVQYGIGVWSVEVEMVQYGIGVALDDYKDLHASLPRSDQNLPVVVTAENLLECLFAECKYWRAVNVDDLFVMGAVGALSNVIAFANVKDWRADWHPQKQAPATEMAMASLSGGGRWLRFMFRMTEAERGLLGRVLSGILYRHSMACYVEPWPEGDYAVYVKAEADNAKLVMQLTKEAGLTPVSAVEVDGL